MRVLDDAAYAAEKARIQKVVEKWHTTIGLKWWTGTYEYDRIGGDFPTEKEHPNAPQVAHCTAYWQYLKFCISFNLPVMVEIEDDLLEPNILHEMVHPLLDELAQGDNRDDAGDHVERVTQMVTNALIWTWDTAYEAGKDAPKPEPAYLG